MQFMALGVFRRPYAQHSAAMCMSVMDLIEICHVIIAKRFYKFCSADEWSRFVANGMSINSRSFAPGWLFHCYYDTNITLLYATKLKNKSETWYICSLSIQIEFKTYHLFWFSTHFFFAPHYFHFQWIMGNKIARNAKK